MGSRIPLAVPSLLGLRRGSLWNWMETLLWNSFLLENNVESAQKGSWEWGTPGTASGDQAAVLFLKPKHQPKCFKVFWEQNKLRTGISNPWKAFSFLNFVPAFVPTILVSHEWGNLHFSKVCRSVRASRLPAFVARRDIKREFRVSFILGIRLAEKIPFGASQSGTKLKLGLSKNLQ